MNDIDKVLNFMRKLDDGEEYKAGEIARQVGIPPKNTTAALRDLRDRHGEVISRDLGHRKYLWGYAKTPRVMKCKQLFEQFCYGRLLQG